MMCRSLFLGHPLGKVFSRQQSCIFLTFPRKQDLTFHKFSAKKNGDSLHEMSNPVFWENVYNKDILHEMSNPVFWEK